MLKQQFNKGVDTGQIDVKPKVLKDLGTRIYANRKRRFAIYLCPFCGSSFESCCEIVNQGAKKSCGCVSSKLKGDFHKTHGLSKHKLFKVWSAMKERCNNLKDKGFVNYGARGISMCDTWSNDFKKFYDWAIESGYKEGLTIDRINNNGNYEPSNCRWTTSDVQNTNKRLGKTSSTGVHGVVPLGVKYVSKISVKNKSRHLGVFETIQEALDARNKYIIENKLKHKIQRIE